MICQELQEYLSHTNIREIWIDYEDLLSCGLTIDELIDLGEPYELFFADHYKELLDQGADPEKLFKLNEPWYRFRAEWPIDLAEIFMVYAKHGLDVKKIRQWFKDNIYHGYFVAYSDVFSIFGINPKKYVKPYLYRFGFGDAWNEAVYGENPVVSPEAIVKYFSLDDIERHFRCVGSNLLQFIDEYFEINGDPELLFNKFLKERHITLEEYLRKTEE